MRLKSTQISDLYMVEPDLIEDERGLFTRWYCQETFKSHGLVDLYTQGNLGYSNHKGTLRGLHLQTQSAAESKLVRCSRGSVFDVAVDCRPDSPTRFQWFGTELSADNRKAIYIPEGFAHGYLTLEDNSEIYYLVSKPYQPGFEAGIAYNDPLLEIDWPTEITTISEKDKGWGLLTPDTTF